MISISFYRYHTCNECYNIKKGKKKKSDQESYCEMYGELEYCSPSIREYHPDIWIDNMNESTETKYLLDTKEYLITDSQITLVCNYPIWYGKDITFEYKVESKQGFTIKMLLDKFMSIYTKLHIKASVHGLFGETNYPVMNITFHGLRYDTSSHKVYPDIEF